MTDYFHLNTRPDAVRAISTLGLAHLGDGVFELMVRSWLCLHGKATSRGLHKACLLYTSRLPLGNICDANGKRGSMDPAIRPVDPSLHMVGRAYTVRCHPGDNLAIHKALSLIHI